MKLTFHAPGRSGWAEIVADRTDFDAYPPVLRLRVDWPIGEANPDRTAIASSLAFSPWIAGGCDHKRPFSALTAQRLSEWFQGRQIWIAPTPVRTGGLPLPRGGNRVHLSGNGVPSCETFLKFVPSDQGSSSRQRCVQIATNTGALTAHASNQADRYLIRLGAAVLVADSLTANEIVDTDFAAECPEEFSLAARLLECVSLGLRDA